MEEEKMEEKVLFEIKDVCVYFGRLQTEVQALKNVSLTVKEGEKIAIVGTSGSGKSTFLNVVSGLERVTSGEIKYNDISLKSLSSGNLSELRLKEFGFVFQGFHLIPSLSVHDNIVLPAVTSTGGYDKDYFNELIEALDIKDQIKKLPEQLSGGEIQRVAIARALINRPKVVFADEPTGNLDSENGEKVFKMLFEMADKNKSTLIYVTHDQSKADLAKRIISIKDGVILRDETK